MPLSTMDLTVRHIEENLHRLAGERQEQIRQGEQDLPATYTPLQVVRLHDLISQLEYREDFLALAVPPNSRSFADAIKRFWKKTICTALRWLLIRQVEFNTLALKQARESARLLELGALDLDELLAALKVQKGQVHFLAQRVLRLEMQQRQGNQPGRSSLAEPSPDAPAPTARTPESIVDLVQSLRSYTRIIITGPQRSGTTIAATILAHELGYEFLPEEAFGIDNLHEFFRLYDLKDRFVVQAPCLCALAHVLPGCVVLMRRNLEDIVRSEKRINWVFEPLELHNYFTDQGPIARVRYEAWDRYQKPRMAHAYELNYEALRGHPLWIDTEARAHFHSRQISEEC